jgi:hypothetical protein
LLLAYIQLPTVMVLRRFNILPMINKLNNMTTLPF